MPISQHHQFLRNNREGFSDRTPASAAQCQVRLHHSLRASGEESPPPPHCSTWSSGKKKRKKRKPRRAPPVRQRTLVEQTRSREELTSSHRVRSLLVEHIFFFSPSLHFDSFVSPPPLLRWIFRAQKCAWRATDARSKAAAVRTRCARCRAA